MAAFGSPEYELTWKNWDMASGPPICALRASARRTSGSGSGGSQGEAMVTGWPTPVSADAWTPSTPQSVAHEIAKHNLRGTAMLAGWPTPMAGTPAQKGYNEAGNTDSSRKTVALLAGWPTATVGDSRNSRNATAGRSPGSKHHAGTTLSDAVLLAGWATPVGRDCGGTPEQFLERKRKAVAAGSVMGVSLTSLSLQAQLTGWNTPRATDGSNGGPNQANGALSADAALSGWCSPTSRDWKDVTDPKTWNCKEVRDRYDQLGRQAYLTPGATPTSSTAPTEKRGALNPDHSPWLMGYPAVWGFCGATAMQSSRPLRRSSSARILTSSKSGGEAADTVPKSK